MHEPPSTFVGRQRELAGIRASLARSRAVTLTGPGGVGKTRLAQRSIADLLRAFPDGVWFVELGSLTDPGLVVQTVGAIVAARGTSRGWCLEELSEYLEQRRMLLILDGCEHLIEAAGSVATELIRTCPQLHVLATSRHALGVEGEARFPVPPLAMPPIDGLVDVEAVFRADAIRLFAERAVALSPDFELSSANLHTIHHLCWRLDGIPLAIELAAGRSPALSLEEILERLDDRFSMLASPSAMKPPHQRTLEATMAWSHSLLTDEERILWRRLCAFSGTFSLDAVERVCADGRLASDVLADLLARLVEKSMVTRVSSSTPSRYRLLETLKQFGLRRLAHAGEQEVVRSRHRDWVASIANGPDQPGSGQPAWFAMIDEELPNLRAALEDCVRTPGGATQGLAICTGAWSYWRVRGPIAEGRHWLETLLPLEKDDTHARAKALWMAGAFAILQNDPGVGRPLLLRSAELGAALESVEIRATAAYYLGLAAYFDCDLDAAESWAEESRRHHRVGENRFGEALLREFLGQVALAKGDYQRTLDVLAPALETSRELGQVWLEGYVIWVLSLARCRLGALSAARELAERSLQLMRSIGERRGMALATEALAWIAEASDDAPEAARLLGAAERLWRADNTTIFGPLKEDHAKCETRTRLLLGEERFRDLHDAALHGSGDQRGWSRPHADDRPRARPHPRLSKRELEVAKLVASGMSNSDIADRLILSKRTVDSHVDHILVKLGRRSRVHIATWFQEQAGP